MIQKTGRIGREEGLSMRYTPSQHLLKALNYTEEGVAFMPSHQRREYFVTLPSQSNRPECVD